MGRKFFLQLFCFCCLAISVGSQGPSSEQRCSDNLQLLLRSLTKYAKDHLNHYPNQLQDLVPRYLSQLPVCPEGGASYARYSVIQHDPERAVLICSFPSHALNPPDYLVLSDDRGSEQPFSRLADPSICRRTLVQLGKRLEQDKERLGQYPTALLKEARCSCGDPIQYHVLANGQNFIAYCPGAAHLGSGLAPFSPQLTPQGLQEQSLFLGQPRPPDTPLKGLSAASLFLAALAISVILALLYQGLRRRRVRLD